jgi:hypothetical protein
VPEKGILKSSDDGKCLTQSFNSDDAPAFNLTERKETGGGFNRSAQHYSAGALWHGAGTILPLSANILEIASVP